MYFLWPLVWESCLAQVFVQPTSSLVPGVGGGGLNGADLNGGGSSGEPSVAASTVAASSAAMESPSAAMALQVIFTSRKAGQVILLELSLRR